MGSCSRTYKATESSWPDIAVRAWSGVSGLERENRFDAINEYLENKSVWVELTGGTRNPFTLR